MSIALPLDLGTPCTGLTVSSLFESAFKRSFNKAIENNTAGKHIQIYLVYLMRLRQAICYPFLLEGMLRQSFSIGEIKQLRKDLSDISIGGLNSHDSRHSTQAEGFKGLSRFVLGVSPSRMYQETFMDDQLDQLVTVKVLERTQCGNCEDIFTHPCRTIEVSLPSY